MYELVKAAGDTYYMDCPVKVGIVKTGADEVCFIDGGSDKDAGKKALRLIEDQGWKLKTIYNTHAHADHIGGNGYLQKQTGCKIYAPGMESAFCMYPLLEPVGLFGGHPIPELMSKFTCAEKSDAEPLNEEALPEGMSTIALPGHCFEMVGFRTKDDVVFLADSLASKETIDKYKITFLFNVQQYLDTLSAIKEMKAKLFVPAHAAATDDISELVDVNIKSVNEIGEEITELCKAPIGFEDLLGKIFDKYDLRMSILQNCLIGNTVKSYLSWLRADGRVKIVLEGNRLLWESTK